MFPFQADAFKFANVENGRQERKKLPDNRRPGCTGYAEMENEDKDRIEDHIDDSADQHTGHGIFRAPIGSDQIAHPRGYDLERHPKGDDA